MKTCAEDEWEGNPGDPNCEDELFARHVCSSGRLGGCGKGGEHYLWPAVLCGRGSREDVVWVSGLRKSGRINLR